jgi:uncharacterized protein DUF6338
MELISKESIGLVSYLLPGFLAAWAFYGLTAHPKRNAFERVVQALIFNAIILVIVAAVRWSLESLARFHSFGEWSAEVNLFWSLVVAAVLGVLFAVFANHDLLHGLFRWLRITKRTSYPSEWFSAFNREKRRVTLHLKDGRRIHGWPTEWPDQADSGHFLLDQASWLLDDGTIAPLFMVDHLVVAASEVEMVEIMKRPEEVTATDEQITQTQTTLLALQTKGDQNGEQSAATDRTRPERDERREWAAKDGDGEAGGFATAAPEEE